MTEASSLIRNPPRMARRGARPCTDRVSSVFAAVYVLIFALCAWAPVDRGTWLLENVVAAPLGLSLIVARRHLPFGRTSYAMLFAFLALHSVGSHYTYSDVPYQHFLEWVFGPHPASARNHYDRAVHLAFGLLLTWPLVEAWTPHLNGRRRLALGVALLCVLSLSTLYELLEWGAARVAAPELGLAFVGAQGDVWDAQKDVALAFAGSLAVACVVLVRFRGARRAAAWGRPGSR